MSKGRGFRGPRRRGFDDDEEQPFGGFGRGDAKGGGAGFRQPRSFEGGMPDAGAMSPASMAPTDATVKWFNAEKGFGFVELAAGAGDAFLHVSVLQAAGFEQVPPGSKLRIEVGRGAKGAQVARVLEVDTSGAADYVPPRASGGMGGGMSGPRPPRRQPDLSEAVEMSGTVKWFNAEKGFGFVASPDGGKDVFVHISVLNAAGLQGLAEGQPVTMQVVQTPKGREAVGIRSNT